MSRNQKVKQPFPQGTRSVYRAIALLKIVARRNEFGGRMSDIAAEAGLSVSTAHRILSVLISEGLIAHDPVSKRYHVGIELFSMARAAFQFSIREKFRTTLERIAQQTEDSVFLLVRLGDDSLCIDRIEGRSPIRALTFDVGARRPLGFGAGSMALLAFLPREAIEAILTANSNRYISYNKMTTDEIREIINQSRQLGYALSQGRFVEGVTAVAVPVFDSAGRLIASVAVSAISQRMTEARRQEVVAILKTEINHIGPLNF